MSGLQRRFERLEQRLKARTKHDGSPRRGFEQNCTVIRAEMEMISEKIAEAEDKKYGE